MTLNEPIHCKVPCRLRRSTPQLHTCDWLSRAHECPAGRWAAQAYDGLFSRAALCAAACMSSHDGKGRRCSGLATLVSLYLCKPPVSQGSSLGIPCY
jgi:hypothetical protein